MFIPYNTIKYFDKIYRSTIVLSYDIIIIDKFEKNCDLINLNF